MRIRSLCCTNPLEMQCCSMIFWEMLVLGYFQLMEIAGANAALVIQAWQIADAIY